MYTSVIAINSPETTKPQPKPLQVYMAQMNGFVRIIDAISGANLVELVAGDDGKVKVFICHDSKNLTILGDARDYRENYGKGGVPFQKVG